MANEKTRMNTLDIVYIGMSIALIAVCSIIAIPIGPVPFTLQTMAICLIAGLFGLKRSLIATIGYIFLGGIGLPIFSGMKGGIGVLFGPTGGYILGFILTAIIVGLVSDLTDRNLIATAVAMVVGIAACYAVGTLFFAIITNNFKIVEILKLCVIPFIIPDIVKIVIASILTASLKKLVR